jgi:hypothetical protein
MAKLYYWISEVIGDHKCYSVIGKTKKDVLRQIEGRNPGDFEVPVRRVLEYKDAFDLFDWVTSEAGGRDCGLLTKPN